MSTQSTANAYGVILRRVEVVETARGTIRHRLTWREEGSDVERSANTRGDLRSVLADLVTPERVDIIRDGRGSVIAIAAR